MALTKVLDAEHMGDTTPKKSALQTFANVLNIGATLASTAGSLGGGKTAQPGNPGKYTLNMDTEFRGGVPAPSSDAVAEYLNLQKNGTGFNPATQLPAAKEFLPSQAPPPDFSQYNLLQNQMFKPGSAGSLNAPMALSIPKGTNF